MRSRSVVHGWTSGAVVLAAVLVVPGAALAVETRHPLDPLAGSEIERAVAVLRAAGKADGASRFPEVALQEPAKSVVLAWKPGDPIPRSAILAVLDRAANRRHEAVVDLVEGRLVSWQEIASAQPMILMEEYDLAANAVRADRRWVEAMERRGIRDPKEVYLDVWAPGELEAEGAGDARIARVLSFHQRAQTNPYGPPIEGVVAVVDLNTWKVIEVIDTGVVPVARDNTDIFDPAVTGPARPALPPLVVSSPEGPGFRLDGQAIAWDLWRLRFSMHPREGLVLHQVGWEDAGKVRSILYRASLSEMMVPYGDPSSAWAWRSAFDEGEYGLGRMASPLEPGKTAPAHATGVDAVFADDQGVAYTMKDAVGIWERDGGVLWNHFDLASGKTAARRGRELVLAFVTTIGNYDYMCHWVLRQDGAIAFEAVLSGSLLTKGVVSKRCEVCLPGGSGTVEPEGEQRHGTLVAENVLAPNHQHFLNLRLDLDVDGEANALKEVNVRPERRGRGNPRKNAFLAVSTYLDREKKARRDLSPREHRLWEVFSSERKNPLGHPTGYALVPGANAEPFLAPKAQVRRLGAFIDHALHATHFRDGEDHAAGRYPSQLKHPDGLARWSADDEGLVATDVVVWYTMGVTHVPRPEEYPIMNSTRVGFRLEPVGFFASNPALDVPGDEPAVPARD